MKLVLLMTILLGTVLVTGQICAKNCYDTPCKKGSSVKECRRQFDRCMDDCLVNAAEEVAELNV